MMDKEDYLLREVAKIGLLLRAIIGSLMHKKENLSITLENQFETTKELLLNEINFDLDKLLALDEEATLDYVSQRIGINTGNLELLADLVFQLGINRQPANSHIYFEKALQLYEYCNKADRTFSMERQHKINEIIMALDEKD